MSTKIKSVEVRTRLVDILRRDLVGPSERDTDIERERLDTEPSRWYLTGFIAPDVDAPEATAEEEARLPLRESDTESDPEPEKGGGPEDRETDELRTRRRSWRPTAIGITVLVPKDVKQVEAVVTWGDYVTEPPMEQFLLTVHEETDKADSRDAPDVEWVRTPRRETAVVTIPNGRAERTTIVPNSATPQLPGGALELAAHARPYKERMPDGTTREYQALTVFLVNKRKRPRRKYEDVAFAFQARLELLCPEGFLPRYDPSGYGTDDWDRSVADLHYADASEYAVGRNTSAEWDGVAEGKVTRVATCPLPLAEVERVAPQEERELGGAVMSNVLRLSQLITTFGPGAMVDLPTRSIMIGGTNLWDVRDPTVSRVINEPRLQQLLERSMRGAGRLPADGKIILRTPPIDADTPGFTNPNCIDALIFPTLFICERIEQAPNQPIRRRRLVKWEQLDGNSLKRKYRMPDDKLEDVSPIRFIGACEQGHIEDIDWRWVVHQETPPKCDRPMYLEEKGTSGSPADTAIVCDCGRRISFQETNIVGRLGPCHGERPWLGSRNREPCNNRLKLLIRTATNTYFTQVVTMISLAQDVDALAQAVEGVWHVISNVTDLATLQTLVQHVPDVRIALQGFDLNDCLATIVRRRDDIGNAISPHPRAAEFDLLASGKATIGSPGKDAHLFAITLPEAEWRRPDKTVTPIIKSVVGVQRLREVSCLYGFTRFEPAPTIEDDLEEVQLAVSGAPVGETLDWLPAIEQFGEGVFIQFEPAAVAAWLERPEVILRREQLFAGFRKWQAARPGRDKVNFPGLPYILVHSLSHALMVEMALESGYPASSLKERVYALRGDAAGSAIHRLGLLIYTASTGAQGTLGGLVGSAPLIVAIIEAALARVSICSNDPVCADHNPTNSNDNRHLHGAACHGCLLVAETSCEKRNEFLDRSLLVPTMAGNGAELVTDLGQLADPSRGADTPSEIEITPTG